MLKPPFDILCSSSLSSRCILGEQGFVLPKKDSSEVAQSVLESSQASVRSVTPHQDNPVAETLRQMEQLRIGAHTKDRVEDCEEFSWHVPYSRFEDEESWADYTACSGSDCGWCGRCGY